MQKRYDDIADRIGFLLRRAGKSQKEYAEFVGRSPSWVSVIKKDAGWTGEMLVASAEYLNTTADYLLMLSDDPNPPGYEEKISYMSSEADEIAQMVDDAPAQWRGTLVDMVRGIIEQIDRDRTERQNNAAQMRASVAKILNFIEDKNGLADRRHLESLLLDDFFPGGPVTFGQNRNHE